jgi:hypothetical protein
VLQVTGLHRHFAASHWVWQPVFAELSYRLAGLVSAGRGQNVTDVLSNR